MRRIWISVITLFVLAALVACGSDDDTTATDDTSSTSSSTEATSSTSTSTSTPVDGEPGSVRVYFAWNEKVGTAGRTLDGDNVAELALEALLAGPDDFETDIGMGTEIPEGTELLGIDIDGGTAVVDLSSDFQSGGGSLSMSLRVAQVVFTLTQFDTVDDVDIHLDGEAVDGIGGEGVPAADLTRADFENETPLILVESPTPGTDVTSPLEVSGISNTFEATVNYAITDGDGLIVDEGFTTASAGSGTWGEFSFVTEFEPERLGLGAVIVFELSAEDGSQQNVYEVPVRMG